MSVVDLGVEVVDVDTAGKLNFLRFNDLLLLLCFLFLLVTLKAELSVVHNATYGRIALRSHKNEIVALVVGILESVDCRDNSDLLSICANYSYLLLLTETGESEYGFVDCQLEFE